MNHRFVYKHVKTPGQSRLPGSLLSQVLLAAGAEYRSCAQVRGYCVRRNAQLG